MKNLQQIINRYRGKIPNHHNCPTSMLAWGGKKYYRINSEKPVRLNSSYGGFILDEKGRVEEYEFISIHDPSGETISTKYVATLRSYYPHPYFPKRKVKSWEVQRIMPGFCVGDVIDAKYIITKRGYEHPEFYKPIYK